MSLRVTLVQSELAWEAPLENCRHFAELLKPLAHHNPVTDLVILPEMFSTGFSMASKKLAESMTGPTVTWMREQASSLNSTLCGSVIIEADGRYYNRFIWMPPNGVVEYYDKKHLFRMSAENENYIAGTARLVVTLNDFRICLQVCYDLRFPVWSRNNGDYDLLLYVANWPAARRQHWRSLLRARAIENLSYVIGVNRVGVDGAGIDYAGDSLAIDFNGLDLTDMGGEKGLASIQLERPALDDYRQRFPAWRDADDFQLV
jgi:omega-amidase